MKLHKLTIQNFRNIEYAEFDLADSNLLLGLNGHGKSTIINALQMVLHGWCEHTTRAGGGFRDLIRTGQKKAVIELELSHTNWARHQITYTLGTAARQWEIVDTTTGEIREAIGSPAALWAALHIDQTHASVCMFPSQIVNAQEFSGILSQFLSGALTAEALAARIPAEHAAAIDAMAKAHHLPLDSVAAFESLGKIAYEQRTLVNRDLKMVDAVIAETGFLKPVTDPATGLKLGIEVLLTLDAETKSNQARLRELYTQRGRAEQAPVENPAMPDTKVLADMVRAFSESHESAVQYEAARVEAEAAQAAMTAANKQQADAITAMTAAQSGAPAMCPTCGGKLTKAKREAMVADAIASAQIALTAAEQAQTIALPRNSAARAALESLTPTAHGVNELAAMLRDARIELAAAERAIENAPIPYAGPTLAEVDAQIAAVESRQATVAALTAALQQHRDLDNAKREAEAYRARLAPIEYAVRDFHAGVAFRELLAAAASGIVETVNARIPGTLAVEADGKAFVLMLDARPVSLASRGQRAQVAYAMAEAFAQCGAPVLLDDTNELDPLNRGALCMRLREAATGTVVLAGTPNSVEPDYPAKLARLLAPMQVIAVEDGQYRVVPALTATAGAA